MKIISTPHMQMPKIRVGKDALARCRFLLLIGDRKECSRYREQVISCQVSAHSAFLLHKC